MCAAVAVGYDWLYPELTSDDRALFRNAIVQKALSAGDGCLRQKSLVDPHRQQRTQVCSGGLMLVHWQFVRMNPKSLPGSTNYRNAAWRSPCRSMHRMADTPKRRATGTMARDTACFTSRAAICLESRFSLIQSEGFENTGFFRIHLIGPSGKLFNYADCNEAVDSASHMFWLAKQFHQPVFAVHERQYALQQPDILHLFWWNEGESKPLPISARFVPLPARSAKRLGTTGDVYRNEVGNERLFPRPSRPGHLCAGLGRRAPG